MTSERKIKPEPCPGRDDGQHCYRSSDCPDCRGRKQAPSAEAESAVALIAGLDREAVEWPEEAARAIDREACAPLRAEIKDWKRLHKMAVGSDKRSRARVEEKAAEIERLREGLRGSLESLDWIVKYRTDMGGEVDLARSTARKAGDKARALLGDGQE